MSLTLNLGNSVAPSPVSLWSPENQGIQILDYNQFDSRFLVPPNAHKTRVALVQPLIPDGNYLPNLGIMFLASILIKEGYDVRVFDENIQDDIYSGLIEFNPAVAGLTCVTAALGSACRLAERLKRELPKLVVMVGGPHMSAVPIETIEQRPMVDYGMIGEAERAFLIFCEKVIRARQNDIATLSEIPGLVFRDETGKVISNRATSFLEGDELDQLPFPAWHLLPIEKIFGKATHGLFSLGKRIMPVMTTRGCPNYCGFCCRVMGFKFRTTSLNRILTEIKWLYDTYAIDEIYFEDDTFTQDPVRAHQLLDAVISLKLPIYVKFANGLRADKVDRALLEKMKAANVYWVGFGIESGSDHTQALMKKKLDLELAAQNVKLAKSMGFKVGSNCIIGYPGETKKSIKESIAYFLKLNLDSFAVVTCVPFPGTTAWQVCAQNNWLTDRANDYDNYWFEIFKVTPLIETPYLSSKELSRAIFWVYVRFYFLNPVRLVRVARIIFGKKILSIKEFTRTRWMRVLRSSSFSARWRKSEVELAG